MRLKEIPRAASSAGPSVGARASRSPPPSCPAVSRSRPSGLETVVARIQASTKAPGHDGKPDRRKTEPAVCTRSTTDSRDDDTRTAPTTSPPSTTGTVTSRRSPPAVSLKRRRESRSRLSTGAEVVGAVRLPAVDRVHDGWLRLAAIGLAVRSVRARLDWPRLSRGRSVGSRAGAATLDARPGRARGAGLRFIQPHGRALGSSAPRSATSSRTRRTSSSPLTGRSRRNWKSGRENAEKAREPVRGARGRPARRARRRRRPRGRRRPSWVTETPSSGRTAGEAEKHKQALVAEPRRASRTSSTT